ncbi:MAG TPA: carboxypeptidase regulatory-like domain-containing protein, partial [Minicystis sp.]|nr:carboxypeptidase regulatory-like domain-containing protein [Minicystis sp.]
AIVVSVVDQDGNPAAGATVLAAGTALWPARSTEASPEGKARIAGLRAGAYDLKARKGDLVSATEIGVGLKRGEVKAATLKLVPGKRVRVLVTDGDDDPPKPLPGASVVLAEEGLSSFPLVGKTGPEGAVVLGPIAKASATASARAPGFVPTPAVRVDEDETAVRVALRKGGAISGDVVDDRGYPIAGATIEVVGSDPEGLPIDETGAPTAFRDDAFAAALPGPAPLIPVGELGVMPGPIPDLPHGDLPAIAGAAAGASVEAWLTRRDGFFRAEPVPPGRVQVIARHPDHVEATSETVTVTSGGEAKVHIVMRQGGFIEGRVLEEDRTPVAGARVEMAATKGTLERYVFTADDGTFTFLGAPDEVLLSVSRPETPTDVAARVTVGVPDRERARVEIVLPKLRDSLRLRVTDDRGYPVDRVEVRALALDPKVPLRKTVFTDGDGDAEVPDSAGVPLRLTLVRPGKAPKMVELDPAPTEATIVMNEGVHAHGEITGRGGRDRLEDAEVTLFTAYGTRHVRTDHDGRYDVDDLAPGRVRISAWHKEYGQAEDVATVEGDRDHPADLGALDLAEAGEVEGQVVDERGDPVAGARVAKDAVPTYLPLGPLPRGIVVTGKDGSFTLGGLPEGTVTLEAYSVEMGRGTAENVEVRAGRTTRRVKITMPGSDPSKEAKGAGSLAVTLGEHDASGKTWVDVVSVAVNSEAEAAGVEPGDTLLAVNGREVHAMDAARKRLTGPLSEDVVLTLERAEGSPLGTPGPFLVRVRRERVRR